MKTRPSILVIALASCSVGSSSGDGSADGTGIPQTGTGPASGPTSAPLSGGLDGTTGGGGESVGDTVRLDVGPGGGDGPGPSGPCSCGEHDWSYVFIANSQQGTVSKVNTRTLAEEGRYLTRPDGAGNPSRTSVSVDGMAVAVANRHTGITKIWSRTEFCDPDTNGVPGLQTSSGKNDVLPWGEDDCVAWHTAFNTTLGMSVQRPVQWTPGTPNALGCNEDQKIWTVTGSGGHSEGLCGPNGVWVHLLDGDTGAVEQSIHLPENEFNCDHTNTGQGIGLGAYGGAVDSHGNFWFHGWGNSKLVRVDVATLAYEIFDSSSGYGITVDTKGRPWFGFPQRFDYATKTWAQPSGGGGSDNGGLAQDLQGRMWTSDGEAGVRWYDVETMDLGDNVSLPGTGVVKGVSVDVDGYIWAVRFGDTRAYKIDPDTYQLEYYEGLDGPYTYSDMTGGALVNVACNPEG